VELILDARRKRIGLNLDAFSAQFIFCKLRHVSMNGSVWQAGALSS